MKRKIFYIMILALTVVAFSSCSKDEYNDTRITYYPTLSIVGDSYISWAQGTEFKDPGYKCILNGEDVTSQVKVSTDMDVNTSGTYTVNYAYTNVDGFSSSLTRTVVVYDTNDAVDGLYKVDLANSKRVTSSAKNIYTSFGKDMYVEITKKGDTYTVSDILGGFYDQGRGNGSGYATNAVISAAADGTLSLISSNNPMFGGTTTNFVGKIDSATKTITWSFTWSGMAFYVTMIKK